MIPHKPCISLNGIVLFSVHLRFYLSEKTYRDFFFSEIFGNAWSTAIFMIDRVADALVVDACTKRRAFQPQKPPNREFIRSDKAFLFQIIHPINTFFRNLAIVN
jgi:hypothetical protein